MQAQMQQMAAQVEALTKQLDQQKRANQGYAQTMQTQGDGAAARQAQSAPDYAKVSGRDMEAGAEETVRRSTRSSAWRRSSLTRIRRTWPRLPTCFPPT